MVWSAAKYAQVNDTIEMKDPIARSHALGERTGPKYIGLSIDYQCNYDYNSDYGFTIVVIMIVTSCGCGRHLRI